MKREKGNSGSYIVEIIKAVIIAVILSLLLILIASFAIKIFNVPTAWIPVIKQVIKGISVLIAVLVSFKLPHNGWVRGIVVGIIYIALSFIIFSLLGGGFEWGLNLLNDVAIGSLTGMISGIIAANVKKSASAMA